MVQSGFTNYATAMGNTDCSGSVRLAHWYKPGSTTYTTHILWAGSSVRWNATNITYVNVYH